MNGENGKKKKSGIGTVRTVMLGVLAILISFAKLSSEELVISIVILMLLGLALGIYAGVKAIKKQADGGGERPDRPAPRREPLEDRPSRYRREAEEDRPARRREAREDRPYFLRRAPLEDKPVSKSTRELLPMDEYERRKRLEQLEGFLKNGTIDKEEYKKLRARYER